MERIIRVLVDLKARQLPITEADLISQMRDFDQRHPFYPNYCNKVLVVGKEGTLMYAYACLILELESGEQVLRGYEPAEVIEVVPVPRTVLGKQWLPLLEECGTWYAGRWRQRKRATVGELELERASHVVGELLGRAEAFAADLPRGSARAIDLPGLESLLEGGRKALADHHHHRADWTHCVFDLETCLWSTHEWVNRVGDRLGFRHVA